MIRPGMAGGGCPNLSRADIRTIGTAGHGDHTDHSAQIEDRIARGDALDGVRTGSDRSGSGQLRANRAMGDASMRLVLDSLLALMLVGVLAGVTLHHRNERATEEKVKATRLEIHRFQTQIMIQAALEKVPLTQRGYPVSIEPGWFGGNLPANLLLDASYPWVEIAGHAERDRMHPARCMATSRSLAKFWYNPYRGVVRGRVPDTVSDATALRLYNRINDSQVSRVY